MVNAASHPTLVQSFKLIMTLEEHYVIEEKVVKSVTKEIILDLQPHNIEKVSHLLRADQYLQISYDGSERWYEVQII